MKKTALCVLLLTLVFTSNARGIFDNVYWLWDSKRTIAFKAVARNDYPTLYRMLKKGLNVNAQDDRNTSLLYRAAFYSRYEMILLLLSKGADPDKSKQKKNNRNDSALIMAAYRGRMDICEKLLKSGADLNFAEHGGVTPLITAVRNGDYGITEMFLKAGADPNKAGYPGAPLHVAVSQAYGKASTGILKILLRYGAKVNVLDRKGSSALAIVAGDYNSGSQISQAKLLLAAGAKVNLCQERDSAQTFPLAQAVRSRNTELAKLFIQHGADVNKKLVNRFSNFSFINKDAKMVSFEPELTPLSSAIKNKYLPMVKLLLKHGAKASKKQLADIKKLKYPGKSGKNNLFKILYSYELVKRAIDAGANINELYDFRESALERAVTAHYFDVVKLLLKHGSKYKNEALRCAVMNGSIESVKLLLKHGADPNFVLRNHCHKPTSIFCLNKNAITILPLLLKAGTDIKQLNWSRENVLSANYFKDIILYKALIKAGADWNNVNRYGKTIPEIIISRDKGERCTGEIKVLLDQGFDRKKIRKLAEKYKRKNLFISA